VFVAVLIPVERGLLAFSIAALLLLAGGTLARRAAGAARRGEATGRGGARASRGLRRRSGALVGAGPLVGLLLAQDVSAELVVLALGAAALAAVGLWLEDRPDAGRLRVIAVAVAAGGAVAAGVRIGPTGVGVLDVLGAFGLIALFAIAVDGLGGTDGLACGIGVVAGVGGLALAGFGGQAGLAVVAAGLVGACTGFLAFNTRPASLFVGRGGRLAIGYSLAVTALIVEPAIDPPASLLVPLALLAVPLLDAAIVLVDRLRRRRPLTRGRHDHLADRLRALGWQPGEAAAVLVAAQALLAALALFAGRDVLAAWIALLLGSAIVVALGVESLRARIDLAEPEGFTRRARVIVISMVVALVVAVVPSLLVVSDVRDQMEQGRSAAVRGLIAARDGDDPAAEAAFREAAGFFGLTRDRLGSVILTPGLVVPGLAPNLRAARALAEVGTDLATAGVTLTANVRTDKLEVVNGRVPLDEVRRVTPDFVNGARTLDHALARLREARGPYLAGPVSEALAKLEVQLARAQHEARNSAASARLSSAILGGKGPRRYLLVVQNNAEARATGGLIGNWGLLTAVDGKVSVGRLKRTSVWNAALKDAASESLDAPADYRRRYAQFRPERALQNVNLSPDFPTVARVLEGLAPQVGLPEVDGVLAVDPVGLAALLQLTGPVSVAGWPTNIDAANVVDVTLRDAYAAFSDTPERADFLGDVAQAVVDEATTGRLGAPARIAKVLGAAAHQGHLLLGFTRPEEQRLAEQLDIAGKVRPVRSDAVMVTTSNAGGNKLDYYLKRALDYRVTLHPDDDARAARVSGKLALRLDNTAPTTGLPSIVSGPFNERFIKGEAVVDVSMYSPLRVRAATVDGRAVEPTTQREVGRTVWSKFVRVPAGKSSTVTTTLKGRVRLQPGGWYELDLGHQPSLQPERARVAVEVPPGWRIVAAPGFVLPFSRLAVGRVELSRPVTVRVRVAPDPPTLDLWDRLEAG